MKIKSGYFEYETQKNSIIDLAIIAILMEKSTIRKTIILRSQKDSTGLLCWLRPFLKYLGMFEEWNVKTSLIRVFKICRL